MYTRVYTLPFNAVSRPEFLGEVINLKIWSPVQKKQKSLKIATSREFWWAFSPRPPSHPPPPRWYAAVTFANAVTRP